MNARQALLPLTLLVLTGACASPPSTAAVYSVAREASLHPGDAIPLPEGNAVFTITGLVGVTNSDGAILMDMPTLESAGLVDYTVMDPFLNTEITYRGPLFSTLLDLWQASPEATNLHVVALNDYTIDIPIGLVRDYPIVFAVQADGEYMPVADRGPAMIVLPYDDFEFDRPASDAMWIWQVKSIEVQ
jgi:hypothetical protein